MKKIVTWIIGIVLILTIVYFVGSGFIENTSAFINDYNVSED